MEEGGVVFPHSISRVLGGGEGLGGVSGSPLAWEGAWGGH